MPTRVEEDSQSLQLKKFIFGGAALLLCLNVWIFLSNQSASDSNLRQARGALTEDQVAELSRRYAVLRQAASFSGKSVKSLLLYEQRGLNAPAEIFLAPQGAIRQLSHRKVSIAADEDSFDDDDFLSAPADIPVDPDSEVNREIQEADRLATRPDVFDEDYVPRTGTWAVKVNNTWNDTDTMCVLARQKCGWSAEGPDMSPPEDVAADASFDLGRLIGSNSTLNLTALLIAAGRNETNRTALMCSLARARCQVTTRTMIPPPPPPPDTWDDGPSLYVPRASTVGWNKSQWDAGEWTAWIITGPVVSAGFVAFVLYCFGPYSAAGALAVCTAVDAATFYWNW